jgi:RNA polymerase sigma-70 factor (ECF subfamily)
MGEVASIESLQGLFERCRDGDETGFAQVYHALGRRLYGTALRMLGQAEEAEDAIQEAFLTLYRRRSELDPALAGAWLKRVLVNGCIDRIRRRRRRPETGLTEEERIPGPEMRKSGAHIDLQRATARLPERARLVFILHDVEGFGHREVADLLGVTEGASKSQLFRARGLLRRSLGSTSRRTP